MHVFLFLFSTLRNLMLPFSQNKLVSFLYYFFLNGLHFLVSSLKQSPFFAESCFSPMEVKKKLGLKIIWIFWRIPHVSHTVDQYISRWLMVTVNPQTWKCSPQRRLKREGRGRDHTLHQAGSQQLQDYCCCGIFPEAKGRDEWHKGSDISACRLQSSQVEQGQILAWY